MSVITGKLVPIKDHILVEDMEFGAVTTTSGIFIPNQNGKTEGIKSRWGKVYAVGPTQKDVKVGEWVCVEHGRWTRGIEITDETGKKTVIRRVENKSIMLTADEEPKDVYIPK